MSENLDLLGDPIPEGHGKRGRPPHLVTDEKRRLVIQLLAFGWSTERISAALAITPPTLRKNYFRELKAKAEARARVEGKLLGALMDLAMAGNVQAISKYLNRLERHDLAELEKRIADAGMSDGRPKSDKDLGKKERRQNAANAVGGKYAVPPGPRSVN
jgi:hypothetical protein